MKSLLCMFLLLTAEIMGSAQLVFILDSNEFGKMKIVTVVESVGSFEAWTVRNKLFFYMRNLGKSKLKVHCFDYENQKVGCSKVEKLSLSWDGGLGLTYPLYAPIDLRHFFEDESIWYYTASDSDFTGDDDCCEVLEIVVIGPDGSELERINLAHMREGGITSKSSDDPKGSGALAELVAKESARIKKFRFDFLNKRRSRK